MFTPHCACGNVRKKKKKNAARWVYSYRYCTNLVKTLLKRCFGGLLIFPNCVKCRRSFLQGLRSAALQTLVHAMVVCVHLSEHYVRKVALFHHSDERAAFVSGCKLCVHFPVILLVIVCSFTSKSCYGNCPLHLNWSLRRNCGKVRVRECFALMLNYFSLQFSRGTNMWQKLNLLHGTDLQVHNGLHLKTACLGLEIALVWYACLARVFEGTPCSLFLHCVCLLLCPCVLLLLCKKLSA